MTKLNSTPNGNLVFCTNCNKYHLEFGNLYFNFSASELKIFTEYINSIDGEYFDMLNQQAHSNRKILLPTKLKGTHFVLHLHELNEMKVLLNYEKKQANTLNNNVIYDFNFQLCYN